METHAMTQPQNEDRLQAVIDELVGAAKRGEDTAPQAAALRELVGRLQTANEHLVLATVKAQVLQEESELRNRRQNEFLAMLAHELRNPMAPIAASAELLKRITAAHPMLPRVQQIVGRQVGHMARLLDDLLDASRIANGTVKLQRAVVALADVLQHSIEVSKPFLDARSQTLHVEAAPAQLCINGDLVRLSQVFSNILINASKYSAEGESVRLWVQEDGDGVLIAIEDKGRGIEPELQPHVFDLFVQGARSLDRTEGGMGIGLAVARGLTEMHGGSIAVRSDGAGTGSRFEIRLPLAHAAGEDDAPASPRLPLPASAGCAVLIVEDNADFVATLSALLELEGHRVSVAENGHTGLALVQQGEFDAIVCDLGLPGIDGYELARQARRLAREPRPFMIALTGYSQQEDRKRAAAAGFDHYLTKPPEPGELLRLIASRRALS
jgi:signal transduction histidine kinase